MCYEDMGNQVTVWMEPSPAPCATKYISYIMPCALLQDTVPPGNKRAAHTCAGGTAAGPDTSRGECADAQRPTRLVAHRLLGVGEGERGLCRLCLHEGPFLVGTSAVLSAVATQVECLTEHDPLAGSGFSCLSLLLSSA